MRIVRIEATGDSVWPDVALNDLASGLNLVFGGPRGGKSTLAQLTGRLLYGKHEASWRQAIGQSPVKAAGSVRVLDADQEFVLRRRLDAESGRTAISGLHGASVDRHTPSRLLHDLTPSALGQLYAVDFSRGPAVERLLSAEFARQIGVAGAQRGGDDGALCDVHALRGRDNRGGAGARQLEELFARRDAATAALEERLAAARAASHARQDEIAALEAQLHERRSQRAHGEERLQTLERRHAEAQRRLRYFLLDQLNRGRADFDLPRHRQQVAELDEQIARRREMIAELQSREAAARRELAELHPDGTAQRAAPLADQRATLAVVERLLDELDAEVAQLARAHEPGRCVGLDAHARLSPVAELLRHQTYALCGQLAEQERDVRRSQLQLEARHAARAQSELSEQLEQLLDRRQALFHIERAATTPTLALPEAPVADHCHCAGHTQFAAAGEATELLRGNRAAREPELRAVLQEIDAELQQARQALHETEQAVQADERRWEALQRERQGSLDRERVDELRGALDEIEQAIERALCAGANEPIGPARVWKASDVLAQLTDGALVQIRLQPGGRQAAVLDAQGRTIPLDALPEAQRDQAYLALTLALVSAHAVRGIELPLLLDEPFLRQTPSAAANMAGVLETFAREGRQVVVFTEDREVRRRCAALGARVYDLDALRARGAERPPVAPAPPRVEEASVVRIVRETVDDGEAPPLRVAGAWSVGEDDRAMRYLDESAPLSEFPVLGEDTQREFARCGVRTIGDLLQADPDALAERLGRPEANPRTVRLWQTHTRLMCAVPGVALNDAQVLAACGVRSALDMARADLPQLERQAQEFLADPRRKRLAAQAARFTCERLQAWQLAAQRAAGESRREDARTKPQAKPAPAASAVRPSRQVPEGGKPPARRTLRFFLEKGSPVEEAPSIGAKTAQRLGEVGIRTVADLLAADPQSAADELGNPRITAALIVQWQQQARLVCCIPELRGYGAQLLVACGIADPQRLATADVAKLQRQVQKLCRSKAGQRILRNGKAPGDDRVAQWVALAARRRPLEAA